MAGQGKPPEGRKLGAKLPAGQCTLCYCCLASSVFKKAGQMPLLHSSAEWHLEQGSGCGSPPPTLCCCSQPSQLSEEWEVTGGKGQGTVTQTPLLLTLVDKGIIKCNVNYSFSVTAGDQQVRLSRSLRATNTVSNVLKKHLPKATPPGHRA